MCKCGRPLIEGRCEGCGRSAFCRCSPVRAERIPVWIERQRRHELPAKELVA